MKGKKTVDDRFIQNTYKELIAELRAELTRIKSAHAEELNRVIEENKKLLAMTQMSVPSKSTDSKDQETESGSPDSQTLKPGEASITDLVAMLHGGTPFQRLIARSQLDQIEFDNRRLGTERQKLRQDYDAIKLENDRLKADKKEREDREKLAAVTKEPEAVAKPAN